mgnify:CR=1 FL=1
MAVHEIVPFVDVGAQIELILDNSKGNDIVAMTDEIDFQTAMADVAEGIYDTIEDAIHEKFFNTGSPYGSYFEFVEVTSPTTLKIRYLTGIQGLRP